MLMANIEYMEKLLVTIGCVAVVAFVALLTWSAGVYGRKMVRKLKEKKNQ